MMRHGGYKPTGRGKPASEYLVKAAGNGKLGAINLAVDSCNVVSLGNDRVLAPAQSKNLNARLRAMGFEVYDPDMSMFLQAGGGVHCMAQSLRREPG